MSAAATAPEPSPQPAPAPAGSDKPSRIAFLLSLVRRLIGYGKELATTVRERGLPDPADAIARFGTIDVAQILACITAGLHRAAALETRLLRCASNPNAQLVRPEREPSRRAPRAAPLAIQPEAGSEPRVVRLPTPEQIAIEVRRRPVGAVIADICYDLGIRPDHPLWRELNLAIMLYDGNLASFFKKVWKRAADARRLAESTASATQAAIPSHCQAPACTGPP